MEQFKEMIIEYWPVILEYAFMALLSFLVFLFKRRVTAIKDTLTSSFKERAAHVDKIDEALRTDMSTKLAEAEAKYFAAVNEIEYLTHKLKQAEAALHILIEDTEVEDGNG